jgi:hypothetical protein
LILRVGLAYHLFVTLEYRRFHERRTSPNLPYGMDDGCRDDPGFRFRDDHVRIATGLGASVEGKVGWT